MGRKKIYTTYELLLAAKLKRAKQYYQDNKNLVNKKRRDDYQKMKEISLNKKNK